MRFSAMSGTAPEPPRKQSFMDEEDARPSVKAKLTTEPNNNINVVAEEKVEDEKLPAPIEAEAVPVPATEIVEVPFESGNGRLLSLPGMPPAKQIVDSDSDDSSVGDKNVVHAVTAVAQVEEEKKPEGEMPTPKLSPVASTQEEKKDEVSPTTEGKSEDSSPDEDGELEYSIDKAKLWEKMKEEVGPNPEKASSQLQDMLANAINNCPVNLDEDSGNEEQDIDNDPYFNH